MLRCIRCSACMNHCPVYAAVGGHAYGWVYPGPMGAVLTPSLIGIDKAGHLPNASTFCGRCESVCPVKIPLPKMMRHWREREFARRLSPPRLPQRPFAMGLGGASAGRSTTRLPTAASRALGWAGRTHGRFRSLPLAGGWTRVRDMPAPGGAQLSQPLGRAAEGGSRQMSDARERILAGIRSSLNRGRLDAKAEAAICARGSRRIAAIWSRRERQRSIIAGAIELFVAMAEEVQATRRPGGLAVGGPRGGRALSRDRKPSGRAGHGAGSEPRSPFPGSSRPLLQIRRGRAEARRPGQPYRPALPQSPRPAL